MITYDEGTSEALGTSPAFALDHDGGAEHVTASCFVFTPDLDQVLLWFHKRGRFWFQLGGPRRGNGHSSCLGGLRLTSTISEQTGRGETAS